jgi:hypothetical protein
MAAGNASDIPDSKSDYCPCNRCTVARKQGMQEVIDSMRMLADKFDNEEPIGESIFSYKLAASRIYAELNGFNNGK